MLIDIINLKDPKVQEELDRRGYKLERIRQGGYRCGEGTPPNACTVEDVSNYTVVKTESLDERTLRTCRTIGEGENPQAILCTDKEAWIYTLKPLPEFKHILERSTSDIATKVGDPAGMGSWDHPEPYTFYRTADDQLWRYISSRVSSLNYIRLYAKCIEERSEKPLMHATKDTVYQQPTVKFVSTKFDPVSGKNVTSVEHTTLQGLAFLELVLNQLDLDGYEIVKKGSTPKVETPLVDAIGRLAAGISRQLGDTEFGNDSLAQLDYIHDKFKEVDALVKRYSDSLQKIGESLLVGSINSGELVRKYSGIIPFTVSQEVGHTYSDKAEHMTSVLKDLNEHILKLLSPRARFLDPEESARLSNEAIDNAAAEYASEGYQPLQGTFSGSYSLPEESKPETNQAPAVSPLGNIFAAMMMVELLFDSKRKRCKREG